jgi:Fur family ferric uptake transcriptional regulator
MSCMATFKAKGLRLTPQRRLIVSAIHDAKAHLTAEEIIDYVRARMPRVNKSTVYRTLQLLEEAGCVYKSELNDRFIYHHAEEGHHHHLVCRRCGRTIDCAEDVFLPVEQAVRDRYGFQAGFKHMVMSGLCRECRDKTG